MHLQALDMFSIGIGPSSSHTIGPMRAALRFVKLLDQQNLLTQVTRIKIDLYGSLALTGEGHGTKEAVLNGLSGEDPQRIETDVFFNSVATIRQLNQINLLKTHVISFIETQDLELHKQTFLPQHANGIKFSVYQQQKLLLDKTYFSIGGGFVLDEQEIMSSNKLVNTILPPYAFTTAHELITLCNQHHMTIAELVMKNAEHDKPMAQVKQEALEIISVMRTSVARGIITEGVLPGKLQVKRRAPNLYKQLNHPKITTSSQDQRLLAMAFAIGVNEENAAFSRIVTAPTNGAAGTIPGVLEYYARYTPNITDDKMIEFILTAGAIGMLYKMGSSISAAEVGCQGEIGVACSMAAAALTAVHGGTLIQITNAAEIAMEHSLGMTCDPIDGLVQIPCIERNGVAASRAIDISRLALLETAPGKVSLDTVIKTMLQTGKDMAMHYKETSLGGLAVNIVSC